MSKTSISSNLKKMISILSDHEFHSGTDIGKSLGLSRGAVWKSIKQLAALAGLHILSGRAVVHALEKATKIQGLQLKWPNDIMWNNHKLGGILIDVKGEYHGSCSVVIGIGLNINMPEKLLCEIEKPWTSLNRIINTPVSRNLIAGAMLDFLIAYLIQFSKSGLSKFITQWIEKDYLMGKVIKVATATKSLSGTECATVAMKSAHLLPENIQRFVPHQANTRVGEGVAKKLGIHSEKIISIVDEYGNSSAAGITPRVVSYS